MDNFSTKALVNLRNFMSEQNIIDLIKKYVKEEAAPRRDYPIDEKMYNIIKPYKIDRERGILYFEEMIPNEFELEPVSYERKFEEDILEKKLEEHLCSLETEIEQVFIKNKVTGKNYCIQLHELLGGIGNLHPLLHFNTFRKFRKDLLDYMRSMTGLTLLSDDGEYYFIPKDKGDIEIKLIDIYEFLDFENWINCSQKEFLSIFLEKNCHTKLQFQCKTPIAIYLLERISVLFKNMSKRKILSSRRFCSCQTQTSITQSNYSTAKHRIDNHSEEKEKIDIFVKQKLL